MPEMAMVSLSTARGARACCNLKHCSHSAVHGRLQASGIKLATLGIYGPLAGTTEAMDLVMDTEHHWFQQSVAFVVAEKPELPSGPWTELTDDEAAGNPFISSLGAQSSLQAVEKASIGRGIPATQQAAFADSLQEGTKPSSQNKAVNAPTLILPGTEHVTNPQQAGGSNKRTAGHAHKGGTSHRATTLRSHGSSHSRANRRSK